MDGLSSARAALKTSATAASAKSQENALRVTCMRDLLFAASNAAEFELSYSVDRRSVSVKKDIWPSC
jgi:hypothetical protein